MAEEVTSSIEIDAPAKAVWEVVMDPSRLGEWVNPHKSVEWSGGDLSKGDSFRQTLRLSGVDTKIEWTVVELDRPKRAVWKGKGPARSVANIVYELSEPSRGTTRFDYTNSFELPGGAVGRLAGRVASASKGRKEAEKTLAKLKQLLES
jgi:carbon monoxide dehydrogenase subunit G